MYAITTADRLEQILFVADDLHEAADFLGITYVGVQSAIRRSKNPKKKMKAYKIFKVEECENTVAEHCKKDGCEITPINSIDEAERVFKASDERYVRHHR